MKTNEELQRDVQDAIKWEPLLHAAEIGVTVKDGIVTLTGVVDNYAKKVEAEEAAKSVAGVKVVIEKIEVAISIVGKKDDGELATDILKAFDWNWAIPKDKIKVKVEDGWVTLEGDLMWNYQMDAAKKTVTNIFGIKGVTNYIILKSDSKDDIEKNDIERALQRNWSIMDCSIQVNVIGNRVNLSGVVRSWYQKEQAERIAGNAKGVISVENNLVIDYNS